MAVTAGPVSRPMGVASDSQTQQYKASSTLDPQENTKKGDAAMNSSWLVYLGLLAVVLMVIVSATVIERARDPGDVETRKIRFAAAALTRILMLIFGVILYFVDDTGRGKEIFGDPAKK